MPDPSAQLWISQADSDRHAAVRLYDATDHRTYCQTLAKYQQTVEKSIKAIAAGIRGAGIAALPTKHYYDHDLSKLISALRHLPKPKENRDIQAWIDRLLTDFWTREVKVLSQLAPKRPAPGALHRRNTEYPYETSGGNWTAPVLRGAFATSDVERFARLAERIYQGAREIVSALRR